MKWYVDELDAAGARGALGASQTAVRYGFYDKFGFRTVDVHTYVDKERLPDCEPITLTTMVRDGRGQ